MMPNEVTLRDDLLTHTKIATSILENMKSLPVGSMVSIEGPWGRGKTDILARLIQHAQNDAKAGDGVYRHVFALDPWMYGSPDLLTPMANVMSRALSETKEQKLARTDLFDMLQGGALIATRTAASVLPKGPLA